MLLQKQDWKGRYPVHCALTSVQSNEVIMHLIDSDPFAMQRQSRSGKQSPLHIVCWNKNVTLAGYMIHCSGSFINIKDSYGRTPLHIACNYKGFDLMNERMLTPVNDSCNNCRREMVEKLLQHPDIDVNSRDNTGETPLHTAVATMSNSCQQLLNHPFINVNCTPLHKATRTTSLDGVIELINNPFILVNQTNLDHKTPLDLIKQTIKELEMLGSNPLRKNWLPQYIEKMRLIEEFSIKRRWNAYEYFFNYFR